MGFNSGFKGLKKEIDFLPSTNYELWIQMKGNETINLD